MGWIKKTLVVRGQQGGRQNRRVEKNNKKERADSGKRGRTGEGETEVHGEWKRQAEKDEGEMETSEYARDRVSKVTRYTKYKLYKDAIRPWNNIGANMASDKCR